MKTPFFENEAQENNVFEIVKTKEKRISSFKCGL
jgi:hypothetical protein